MASSRVTAGHAGGRAVTFVALGVGPGGTHIMLFPIRVVNAVHLTCKKDINQQILLTCYIYSVSVYIHIFTWIQKRCLTVWKFSSDQHRNQTHNQTEKQALLQREIYYTFIPYSTFPANNDHTVHASTINISPS